MTTQIRIHLLAKEINVYIELRDDVLSNQNESVCRNVFAINLNHHIDIDYDVVTSNKFDSAVWPLHNICNC